MCVSIDARVYPIHIVEQTHNVGDEVNIIKLKIYKRITLQSISLILAFELQSAIFFARACVCMCKSVFKFKQGKISLIAEYTA